MSKSSKAKRFYKRRISLVILCLLAAGLLVTIITALQLQELQSHAVGVRFATLPPGSALPTDAECAQKVRRSSWEPRPENQKANNDNVSTAGYRLTGSSLAQYGKGYEDRVTGNFTGTTDEIIQWGACKWGFDEDNVRAEAVDESQWKQSTLGDCKGTSQPDTKGCQSMGLLQIKGANIPPTHPGTYPYARDSTAFNVDYALAVRRACFEGKETWLGSGYAAGDEWGCIGRWYSGKWHDSGAEQYITRVKGYLASKPWNTYGAGAAPSQPTDTNAPANPATTTASTSATTPASGVTPTFQCIGGVPCTPTNTSSPSQPAAPPTSPSLSPLGKTNTQPSIAQPLGGESTTTQPCTANQTSVHSSKGFLQAFSQFFLLLIQLLLQVIGGGASTPCSLSQ